MLAGCFYHSRYGQNGDRFLECNNRQGDALDEPCSLYLGAKRKEKRMPATNGNCPHGHPVQEALLPNGMRQAIGGRVSNHPTIPDGDCPLCVSSGWKGLPYLPDPPKATLVHNPEQSP